MNSRERVRCSLCGADQWSDTLEARIPFRKIMFRKRALLIGLLYGGWLTLLGLAFAGSEILGLIWLGLGAIASFIGLIVYVVSQWDRL